MVFGLSVLNRVCDFVRVCLNRVYNFAQVCPSYKQGIACPKQGNIIELVVLNRVCILGFFCPKQGQGFKPSAAHLYPNMGRVPPPPGVPGDTENMAAIFGGDTHFTRDMGMGITKTRGCPNHCDSPTTAAVTEKVWGEYVPTVRQIAKCIKFKAKEIQSSWAKELKISFI